MAHIHELIDFVVTVFIVYEDKVLLILHKKLNKWLPIGGHIELDEDPEQALLREVKEECGLEIEVLSRKPELMSAGTRFLYTPNYLDVHDISNGHRHVSLTYFARAKSDKFVFNKEEHNEIKWFSKEDLEKPEFNITPAVKFYANEAFKMLGKES